MRKIEMPTHIPTELGDAGADSERRNKERNWR